MAESYPEFFLRVTGNRPLPYQERYGSNPFSPTLLVVPTGLGKTDAVLMRWLYGRATADPNTPTRLTIVLPRRNLTTQTAKTARLRVERAELNIPVIELLAGSRDNEKKLRPDQPAIIVATQDLYFSRALNRGYARRPPRWPIDFALYNQDCLIVLDEIQLMDDALATSTQMAAFREFFGIFGAAPCVWMSATVNPRWMRTVDFSGHLEVIRLDEQDDANEIVKQRIHAAKRLAQAPDECRTPAGCAAFVLRRHREGTRSLVIANTVARAREIFAAIRKHVPNTVLLHSRFRPQDRKLGAASLDDRAEGQSQIVVATQVLEAGIDITSRLLITDLAPWGSMVQRFGRVNRGGKDSDSEIWWVDEPTSSKQKDPTAPYSPDEISHSRERIRELASAAPAGLPKEDGPEPYRHVLRKADLLDLFDTTPDLAGNDIDVSRFIRATDDKNVYLAWRDWAGDAGPPEGTPELIDDELCPVPIGGFREFAKKHAVYTLSFATEEWIEIGGDTPVYPGMLAVTRLREGGYTPLEGWSPESKAAVTAVPTPPETQEAESDTSDPLSFPQYRQTLGAHTNRVMVKLEELLAQCRLNPELEEALKTAARLHDWGKVHCIFQMTMHRGCPSAELLAKRCGNLRHAQKHFRHELASALAILENKGSDLVAYLAAAHHGRIRMNIRSMPGEREEGDAAIARGIRTGDSLEAWDSLPATKLSLDIMEFGAAGGSWTERMLRLRDDLGPFRLAYLEMLLRAADELASEDHGEEVTKCQ